MDGYYMSRLNKTYMFIIQSIGRVEVEFSLFT